MKRIIVLLGLAIIASTTLAQSNITISNPEAEAIIHGSYDPNNYLSSNIINHPDSILNMIVSEVSSDTMINWLAHIDSYHNRNTGSDTISDSKGIGAVRRWIYSKLEEISSRNEDRLIVSFQEFDVNICGIGHHKNVFGILPGMDTTKKEIIFIEGHFDTRCEGVCDTVCHSPGMDDNGSGTVLVMELARVMSQFSFDHSIIFCLTTGEDQGLYGATAFARYFYYNDLDLRAVLNNDVVGGITCGATSSPPSCPYQDHIDSTHVRIFSYSQGNDSSRVSSSKQLARYLQVQQSEKINPLLNTPLEINIMIYEDRIGRSGDHKPFRQRGYPAIRYCSQNEHGDGSGTFPDRQHSTRDILGEDLSVPPDGILDTFYVDPGYLKRNTISNGVNAGFLAIAPPNPNPEFYPLPDGIKVEISDADTVYQHYRLCVRSKGSGSLNFDTLYTFNTTHFELHGLNPDKTYYFSVMNVHNNVESLPSEETTVYTVGTGYIRPEFNIKMMQNRPNPFNSQTYIPIVSAKALQKKAEIRICDIFGRPVKTIPFFLDQETITLKVEMDTFSTGYYTYSLFIDNMLIQSKKMLIN